MELKINPADIRWWLWVVTLAFMAAAVAGWTPGYYAVIAVSALQVIFSLAQDEELLRLSRANTDGLVFLHAVWLVARRAAVCLCPSSGGRRHGDVLRTLRHRPGAETHALESGPRRAAQLSVQRTRPG